MLTREELAHIIQHLMEEELCSGQLGGLDLDDNLRIVPWDYLPDGEVSFMLMNNTEDPLFAENDLTLLQCLDLAKGQGFLK